MKSYPEFVSEFARLMREGKNLPLGGVPPLPAPDLPGDAPRALIFSPHPDDECIIGGLPLRLMRECGMRVVNVAVTQGSRKDRQQERLTELKAACDYIGFGLIQTAENGLENVNPKGRQNHPDQWRNSVARTAEILREQKPEVIFVPHDDDFNTTHIGTHHLVVEALRELGDVSCWAVETEFWGAMKGPNLMVESSDRDVADLLTALSFHVGEVNRNPYHLRMPGWLMDNVRRGGEVVGGQGGAAPDFLFATLYRLRRWEKTDLLPAPAEGRSLSRDEDPATLFQPVTLSA
jgi:N-acetylglucosamine malate deacetylase 1